MMLNFVHTINGYNYALLAGAVVLGYLILWGRTALVRRRLEPVSSDGIKRVPNPVKVKPDRAMVAMGSIAVGLVLAIDTIVSNFKTLVGSIVFKESFLDILWVNLPRLALGLSLGAFVATLVVSIDATKLFAERDNRADAHYVATFNGLIFSGKSFLVAILLRVLM